MRKLWSGIATRTTITGLINNSVLSIPCTNLTGWPTSGSPFVAVIDGGTVLEEWVLCDSRASNTLTVNALGRGYVGTAQTHQAGATIRHAVDFNTIDEANRYVNLMTAKGMLTGFDGSLPQILAAPAKGGLLAGRPSATLGWEWKAVGADGLVLQADSTDNDGVSYRLPTIPKFATLAAIIAGYTTPGPVEGDLAHATSEDRLYQYDGAAWQRIAYHSAAGRTGGRWRQVAGQSTTGGGGAFVLTWDTEDQDSDNFGAAGGTTLTIPAGLDGLYSITIQVFCPAGTGQFGSFITINGIDVNYCNPPRNQLGFMTSTIILQMVATTTVAFKIWQSSGVTENMTAVVELWRIGR